MSVSLVRRVLKKGPYSDLTIDLVQLHADEESLIVFYNNSTVMRIDISQNLRDTYFSYSSSASPDFVSMHFQSDLLVSCAGHQGKLTKRTMLTAVMWYYGSVNISQLDSCYDMCKWLRGIGSPVRHFPNLYLWETNQVAARLRLSEKV